MKNIKLENYTREMKIEQFAKYINNYTDGIINTITTEAFEKYINDNTLMKLIIYVNNCKINRWEKLINHFSAPFENEFYHYDYKEEINNILYDLIIKD